MARYTGKSVLKQVYNIQEYYPLDTRMLVPTYEDLTTAKNWEIKGENYAYNGMIVAVGNDTSSGDTVKNGVYYLFDAEHMGDADYPDVTNEANWHKLGSLADVAALSANIPLTVATTDDLPETGVAGKIYVVTSEAKTYIWHDNKYMPVGDGNSGGTGGGGTTVDIQIIHGGSATKVGD